MALSLKQGVLAIVMVTMMVGVGLYAISDTNEVDESGDGTIYLRLGDTYTWTPTFNIDSSRIALSVNTSTTTTAGTFSSSSTAGGVTATANADKSVSVAVGSSATVGTVYVKVNATTTSGVSQSVTATITVNVINPTIAYESGTQQVYQGQTGVSISPTISGLPSGKTATYTATGLPSGLSINASTGVISGTVSASEQAKSYTVTVRGSLNTDPQQTFSTTKTINVSTNVVLNTVVDQYFLKGVGGTFNTGASSGTVNTYAITKVGTANWTSSSGFSINASSGEITVGTGVNAGDYQLTYTGKNTTSNQTVTKTVNVHVMDLSISYANKNTYIGGTVDIRVTVNGLPSGKNLSYSATGLPSGLSINASTGKITGTVASDVTAGNHTVTVSAVSDTVPNQTVTTTFTINVSTSMVLNSVSAQYTINGTAKTFATGLSSGTATSWKINSVTKDGSAYTIPSSNGISIATDGKITVGTGNSAGKYVINYSASNSTSGQTVSQNVTVYVGKVDITSITAGTGGVVGDVSSTNATVYTQTGVAGTFTVVYSALPSSDLKVTASLGGANANAVTLSSTSAVTSGTAITFATGTTLGAGNYTFTITLTQASTNATETYTVTLVVDPVLDFTSVATSGTLSIKGAGN